MVRCTAVACNNSRSAIACFAVVVIEPVLLETGTGVVKETSCSSEVSADMQYPAGVTQVPAFSLNRLEPCQRAAGIQHTDDPLPACIIDRSLCYWFGLWSQLQDVPMLRKDSSMPRQAF